MLEPLLLPHSAVLLSPHSDDVCFSASRLARAARTGILLTLHSRSSYTVGRPCDLSVEEVARVSELRRAEDSAFAAACGIGYEALGLDDAPLRGVQAFQPCTPADMQHVEGPLAAWLARVPAGFDGGILAAPAGIGGHVDHVAVRNSVIAQLPDLQRRFDVCFYEDLHYASDPERLEKGQAELLASMPPEVGLARVQIPLRASDVSAKLSLIALYRSQLRETPTTLAAFSPAGHPTFPNEAVWVVKRPS